MKEFLINNWETILTIVAGLLTAMATLLGITNHRINKIRKLMKQSDGNGYRIVCPHCHKESPIEQVTFKLPSGALDNNLNGIPDDQE